MPDENSFEELLKELKLTNVKHNPQDIIAILNFCTRLLRERGLDLGRDLREVKTALNFKVKLSAFPIDRP
jgi:hypothetical protein